MLRVPESPYFIWYFGMLPVTENADTAALVDS